MKTERFELRMEREVKHLAQLLAAERRLTISEYIRSLIHTDAFRPWNLCDHKPRSWRTDRTTCPHNLPTGCCLVCDEWQREERDQAERAAILGMMAREGQLEAGYDIRQEVPR